MTFKYQFNISKNFKLIYLIVFVVILFILPYLGIGISYPHKRELLIHRSDQEKGTAAEDH